MTKQPYSAVLRQIHLMLGTPGRSSETDAHLLERFVAGQEKEALALLLQRYGPLVWGVCRRVLRESHEAEDAFQATFLVLAQKAASIRKQQSLAGWLYQ